MTRCSPICRKGKQEKKKKEGKEERERQGQRNTKEIGTQKVLEVEESLWEEGVRKNASAKGLGLHN